MVEHENVEYTTMESEKVKTISFSNLSEIQVKVVKYTLVNHTNPTTINAKTFI